MTAQEVVGIALHTVPEIGLALVVIYWMSKRIEALEKHVKELEKKLVDCLKEQAGK